MAWITFDANNWETPRSLRDYAEYVYGYDDVDVEAPPSSSSFLDRKCRLLVVAALRAIWEHVSDARCRSAIEAFEAFADDGDIEKSERAETFARQAEADSDPGDGNQRWEHFLAILVHQAVSVDRFDTQGHQGVLRYNWENLLDELSGAGGRDWGDGQMFHFRLFHDVFGNPFRQIACDPAWRTETVVALAAGIYEERAFERMPVLADALEDAGCANPDVLAHCRSGGPHARGCWVVDLLLGKA